MEPETDNRPAIDRDTPRPPESEALHLKHGESIFRCGSNEESPLLSETKLDATNPQTASQTIEELTTQLAAALAELSALKDFSVDAERWLSTARIVTRMLAKATSLAEIAPALLQTLGLSFGWEVGMLWLVEIDLPVLQNSATWSHPRLMSTLEQAALGEFEDVERELPTRVLAAKAPVWIHDESIPRTFRNRTAAAIGLPGAIGFPIRHGSEFRGVLEFFSSQVAEPDVRVLAMMAAIGAEIGQFIERQDLEGRLRKQQFDRGLAEQIQRGLLPRFPPALPGFEISGRMLPADFVGGDFFDFIPVSESSLVVVVADASGHGLGAALLAVQTRAYLRALILTCSDPGRLLDLTNDRLSLDLQSSHFVTGICLTLDSINLLLGYSSAGHLSGVVFDAQGRIRELLPSTGLPLGISTANTYPARSGIPLASGDLLLLVTDGIVEAADPDFELFGMDRALEVVRQHRQQSADDVLAALFEAVNQFCHSRRDDDLTAVIIKVSQVAASPD